MSRERGSSRLDQSGEEPRDHLRGVEARNPPPHEPFRKKPGTPWPDVAVSCDDAHSHGNFAPGRARPLDRAVRFARSGDFAACGADPALEGPPWRGMPLPSAPRGRDLTAFDRIERVRIAHEVEKWDRRSRRWVNPAVPGYWRNRANPPPQLGGRPEGQRGAVREAGQEDGRRIRPESCPERVDQRSDEADIVHVRSRDVPAPRSIVPALRVPPEFGRLRGIACRAFGKRRKEADDSSHLLPAGLGHGDARRPPCPVQHDHGGSAAGSGARYQRPPNAPACLEFDRFHDGRWRCAVIRGRASRGARQ